MGKTRWTEEQREAIYVSGTNLLISAGAGSGKTAVLTERILEKLKQGMSLRQLIVLTFTNAAAFEMKERVRKKIQAEIDQGNLSLQTELDFLDNASICTFDSFSLNLVKKYHYLLGLEPSIHICDTVILLSKKKAILDQVFLSLYEEKNPDFLTFIDTFSIKDDTKLQNYVAQIASKLDSLYDKNAYLDTYIDVYYQKEKIAENIQKYVEMLRLKRDLLFLELEEMESKITNDTLHEWYEKLYENVSCLEKGNTYDTFHQVQILKLPAITRSQKVEEEEIWDIKENYSKVKEYFDFIKKRTLYTDIHEIETEILDTKKTVAVIIEIIKRYEIQVLAFKKEHNMFEFSDIGRFAIQILEQNPSIREEYKRNTTEIMIDEYQDTNDIGEYFVSLIAHDNVYMVGDVKQSIYGFRNANPRLFMQKYENYKKEQEGHKIDLVKNFRSRKEVLDGINTIFGQIMDLELGGADYNHGHQMLFGNQMYEENKPVQQQELEILDYHYEKGEYSKEETEAFIIGKDILDKIKTGYQVIDEKNGGVRPAQYQDFTILMDRKTQFDLYKKIFTYLEIPMTIHKEEGFGESNELYTLHNVLQLIEAIRTHDYYGNTFSHSLMSVMRSFLCDYNDTQIFELFLYAKQNNITLYKALREEPYQHFYQKLKLITEKASFLPLTEFLAEVYETFSFYDKVQRKGDVVLAVHKLDYVLDVAKTVEEMSGTLSDLIAYLEEALHHKIEASFSSEKGQENAVQMMTIHKSKGLEFPICYYSGLYKKFSSADFKDKFLYSSTYGILTPVYVEGIKETIYKELLKNEYYEKDVSEKIRLFYVALTRAKEKIILVAPLQDAKGEEGTAFYQKVNYRSFYDMLSSIRTLLRPYCRVVSLPDIPRTHAYLENKSTQSMEQKIGAQKPIPIRTLHLQKEETEVVRFSHLPSLLTKEDKKNMEFGTLLHHYLEQLDFQNMEEEYERYQVSSFFKQKMSALLKMPFLRQYKNLYKEYSFIEPDTGQLGIIDLLIETEDKFIIVDYKTKEIDKESYKNQVNGYKKYIQNLTGKRTEGYLYSLLDEQYQQVEDV